MPKQVDHEGRRAALAEAARRLLRHDGLEAVTMRQVATEAGVSLGQVQYYVAGKDELVRFALDRVSAQVEARLADRHLDTACRSTAGALCGVGIVRCGADRESPAERHGRDSARTERGGGGTARVGRRVVRARAPRSTISGGCPPGSRGARRRALRSGSTVTVTT
ncbi:TetR family transcriptional regulator [Allosaccharopolyspora coralli]|uniref:TetR family transcriptional regulator n=1 Tax=Allosaccharopolyspora coralli TaxID=2665642 RepID=A0A5Q3Q408_9PSEU|nr:TetR family transcriptional regulator [Allosaccharopolyspora coralli]